MANGKRPPPKRVTPQPVRTHTGWLRDLERAMRASDFHVYSKLVFSEMIDHTSDNDRTCWASFGTMAIRLKISVPTVSKFAKQLENRNVVRRIGRGPKGTIKFEILDGWVNPVIDAMTMRLDKYKESVAARQAKSRAKRKANVTQPVLRPESEMSRNIGLDLSHNDGFDKHLQVTPPVTSSEEEDNAYARAKARF